MKHRNDIMEQIRRSNLFQHLHYIFNDSEIKVKELGIWMISLHAVTTIRVSKYIEYEFTGMMEDVPCTGTVSLTGSEREHVQYFY